MSEVISFRLNKSNPREAQALEILESWCSKGYSVRYIITAALLNLDDSNPESVANPKIRELNEVLDQAHKLLEQLQEGDHLGGLGQQKGSEQQPLVDNFIASIRKAAKPGLKSDKFDG